MKYPMLCLSSIILFSACAGQVVAGGTISNTDQFPAGIAHPDELFMQGIASNMFRSLPKDQQAAIAKANGIGSQEFDLSGFTRDIENHELSDIPQGVSAVEYLGMLLSDEMRNELTTDQLKVVTKIASLIDQGTEVPMMCFTPDTSLKYAFIINQLLDYQFMSDDGNRFQSGPRWSRTAVDGGGLQLGEPTTITYSFPPDGSFIPDFGFGTSNTNLFQWLDGIYGNTTTWQNVFHQVFQRWEDLIGTTYVWEQNDDGASMIFNNRGIVGVRGDVRIFASIIDGNSGILAFNFFPDFGDMLIDSADSFYENLSNNSLRMRNVVAHEHGHGLGMNHVCPIQQSVLMEPFVSVQFDGPQLDDVLNGIRHYGDVAEPNDSIAQATDLGSVALGGSVQMSNIGLDALTDNDYFSVTVSELARITFTVTPDADEYIQGPQTGGCDVGDLTDYNSMQDLRVSVLDSFGNVLSSSNENDIGESESIGHLALTAGEYFFVVDGDGGINNVQRYSLNVTITDGIFINPVIISNAPDTIDPGIETPFVVTVNPQDDILIPDTGILFVSINGGSFTETSMISNGPNSYTATFPAVECNDLVTYYLSVQGQEAGEVTFPIGGASSPVTVGIGDFVPIFSDNFETDLGWIIGGGVTGTFAGQWERGVPAGIGDRGDPSVDADGSGSAYLTGNAAGNTDVDGGRTILISPAFAMLDNPDGRIFYSRWYDNTGAGLGSNPGEDVFTVQVSNTNGSSWVTVEIIGPSTPDSSGGWVDAGFLVSDYVVPNNQTRVRFIAEDFGNSSVIEAAVDGFITTGQSCDDPKVDCIADFDNSGSLNFFDISAFLTAFNDEDPAADLTGNGSFNFFDISEFLTAFAEGCP